MIEEKVLRAIEFDKLKQKIAEFCVLKSGKEVLLAETPCCDYENAVYLLDKTEEAYALLFNDGVSGIEFFDDPKDAIQAAAKGSSLSMGDLLKCARFLKSARILYSSVLKAKSDAPILKNEISGIFTDQYVENEIFSKIVSDDAVSDTASEKLYALRKNIRSLNERIREKLLSFVKDGKSDYLQENVVTMRGDRYVLPVKSEYKGRINGFIHDRSATGSTLFIEPAAVLELNNALRTAKLDEQAEIERILADLSGKIGVISDRLLSDFRIITDIDAVYARAIYAYKTNSVRPKLNSDGTVDIKNGRHPLIPKEKVVPVSLAFGKEYDYLLITGPNTGGKTVTLKMTGLFAAMATSGMFVPASDGTEIACFGEIFCDVGDEQSIENSLSTFSSHIKNIISITENADGRSLVLIDEIGAGTDPDEGSALARAVIDDLLKKGSRGVITTHYSALKEFAYTEKLMKNASMEFDPETFAPLYKINIGMPGTSNALEISEMLGMPKDIVRRAAGYMGNAKLSFEKVLKEAEKTRREAENLKAEVRAIKAEESKKLEEIDAEREKLLKDKEKFYAGAKAESRRIVNEKIEEADEIINEIKTLFDKEELTSGDLIRARTLRNDLERKKYAESEREERTVEYEPINAEKLKIGDKVYHKPTDMICTVNSVNVKKGECEVFPGSLRVMAKIKDLFFVAKSEGNAKTTVSLKRNGLVTPATEINVIGKNVSEALYDIENFLDAAVVNNLEEVKIIHGKGLKILSSAVHDYLKRDPRVSEYRFGKYGEGERGVTFVKLK